jgi:hypothetical protein
MSVNYRSKVVRQSHSNSYGGRPCSVTGEAEVCAGKGMWLSFLSKLSLFVPSTLLPDPDKSTIRAEDEDEEGEGFQVVRHLFGGSRISQPEVP